MVGVPEDFSSFCAREYQRLVGSVSLYTGNAAMAEDVAQEALARACRDWTRVSRMAAPGAWAHRVAINVATSQMRRQAVAQRLLGRTSAQHAPTSDTDQASIVAVRVAVRSLPHRRRVAVVLKYFLDFDTAEIAEVLGVREATVRSLLHRARGDLASSLGTEEGVGADVPRFG